MIEKVQVNSDTSIAQKSKAELDNGALEELRSWFLRQRRHFPWRELATPYSVWISEIMLQQTRADVVVPYFQRWLKQFSNVHALARASLESVIKAWEGLGYYSRARNIHKTAKQIVEEFGGVLPDNESDLLKLNGIGPYTAAAIASFAHHQRAAPLDGNALRVLARWWAVQDDVTLPGTKREMQRAILKMLPISRPWEIAEALIELGALVCKKSNPDCALCPLQGTCAAFQQGLVNCLPVKAPRKKCEKLTRLALIIEGSVKGEQCILVQRRLAHGVMRDLWEFPYTQLQGQWERALLAMICLAPVQSALGDFGLLEWSLVRRAILQPKRWTSLMHHTFTRYKVALRGLHCASAWPENAIEHTEDLEMRFVRTSELEKLPFSAGHRLLLQELTAK